MKELVEQIKNKAAEILAEIDKTDVKAAKQRVRIKSVELEKLFKQYRKESLK